ncbi:L-seryl-tRNA(Sec) selenium transferase [Sulfurospirillum multivorans]|uniref:L-seryl-tRNA(Sec) selenium transferase n=2 Tax=Sulfurospirillum multivorans TaxID=66821 RepID=A0AA86APP0_SULMK|nr:L-seryl-tRNA(Sec) selenium transferase [Sulfurospirillum multivorans]AHJ14144.1 L-seryl-tRNA(Sec) selenium transferase [Sulfurospirillum multivorans DSM 12446]QEH07629.1 L-seryl-tRNA(Sec) selenium transferase [Sulfurospirillum multivorans]
MNALKTLPKVDKCLTHTLFEGCNATLVMKIARIKIEEIRQGLITKEIESFDEEALMQEIKKAYDALFEPSLKPLINATGVILHTNMGRSLISKTLLDRASDVICNYSNLEYNLELGSRGERYEHVSTHLRELLNVEDVLVVNNNASAVFLILNTFAKNQEVVVSRGELVEIGGSFRIPEVMKQSGAILNEVGATNKTKITDYESAINENIAMLMKVHQSNFSIEGFSEAVAYEDLKQLATQNNLLDYYDLGSGYVPKLPYNLGNREHSLSEILTCNPSLISFSGDKLFGSVQAGIIAGRADLIAKLKKNQLLRMLRVDKITLSLLEESIKAYLAEEYEQIPTLWLLFRSVEELTQRALHVKESVGKNSCEIVESETYMGGGTLPNRRFPTIALHVKGKATLLERKFRENHVIGRIENDHFLLDFRTILPSTEEKLSEIIKRIVGN